MDLLFKIANDLKESMKSGNAEKVAVLRMISAALKNREIEKRGRGQTVGLTDEEALAVLQKEAKKRKESIEAFSGGGRPELADKEKAELEIISFYLPRQMSEEEVRAAV